MKGIFTKQEIILQEHLRIALGKRRQVRKCMFLLNVIPSLSKCSIDRTFFFLKENIPLVCGLLFGMHVQAWGIMKLKVELSQRT